jgi:hypothetical protein
MAATVEIDGQKATIEEYEWSGDEPLSTMLNLLLDPLGPSGSDPNSDYTAAKEMVDRFRGKLLSFDKLDFDPDVVY